VLEELDEDLSARGVLLVFAEMKDPVRSKLERYRLSRPLAPDRFFPTLDAAVEAFHAQTEGDWNAPEHT